MRSWQSSRRNPIPDLRCRVLRAIRQESRGTGQCQGCASSMGCPHPLAVARPDRPWQERIRGYGYATRRLHLAPARTLLPPSSRPLAAARLFPQFRLRESTRRTHAPSASQPARRHQSSASCCQSVPAGHLLPIRSCWTRRCSRCSTRDLCTPAAPSGGTSRR